MANGGWELQDVRLKPGEDPHEEILARHGIQEMTAASARSAATLRVKSTSGAEPKRTVFALWMSMARWWWLWRPPRSKTQS